MRLGIDVSAGAAGVGRPVALVDVETRALVGRYGSLDEARRAKAILESGAGWGEDDDSVVRAAGDDTDSGYCPLCGDEHVNPDDDRFCVQDDGDDPDGDDPDDLDDDGWDAAAAPYSVPAYQVF